MVNQKRVINLNQDRIKLSFYGGPIRQLTLEPVTPIVAEIGEEITFRVVEIETTSIER